MLYYVIEVDAKRCFPHCDLLPLALIPLGITAKEKAKKKNKCLQSATRKDQVLSILED